MNNVFNLALKTDFGISKATYSSAPGPFLSIITRTQGRRPHTLVEVLTCLAAQTDTDFEVLLLGHRLDLAGQDLVLGLIDDCPSWLRNRIRYIAVPDGTRTWPLKLGVAAAQGDFIALLDDDDIIFAHWVETFRNFSSAMPGCILRSNTVLQVVDTVSVQGMAGLRGLASPELRYPKTFNFFDHILENRTPPMTLAFPRLMIEQEGIKFDEALTTTEDWDFFMRCAQIANVADASEITSVYRWWDNGESSRTVHDEAEWKANHYRIWENWDSAGFRLPPGCLRELVGLLQEHAAFSAELRRQQRLGVKLALDTNLIKRNSVQLLTGAKLKVAKILKSTSWRLTWPLRALSYRIIGGQEVDAAWLQNATAEQAEALVFTLYHSRSWRLAAPIRLGKRLLGRFRGAPVARW